MAEHRLGGDRVAAVVVTVATLGTAGPVAMVLGGAAIGAVAGAASGAAREGLESGMNLGDGEFNGETIIRDAVVGGLGGALVAASERAPTP